MNKGYKRKGSLADAIGYGIVCAIGFGALVVVLGLVVKLAAWSWS